MNKKLTITIEKNVIDKANAYAEESGKSLSVIIENFLKSLTPRKTDRIKSETPVTDSLKGSFNAPNDIDYDKVLKEELSGKHE